jgi:hypothetical protein
MASPRAMTLTVAFGATNVTLKYEEFEAEARDKTVDTPPR